MRSGRGSVPAASAREPAPYARGRRSRFPGRGDPHGDLMHFARKLPSIPMQRRMKLDDLIAARRLSAPAGRLVRDLSESLRDHLGRAPRVTPGLTCRFPGRISTSNPGNIATFAARSEPTTAKKAVFLAQGSPPRDRQAGRPGYRRPPIQGRPDRQRRFLSPGLVGQSPSPAGAAVALVGGGSMSTVCCGRSRLWHVQHQRRRLAGGGQPGCQLSAADDDAEDYGVFLPDGSIDVRLTYDHRVLDGANVAQALAAMEEVLNGEILPEQANRPPPAAAKTPRRCIPPWPARTFSGAWCRSSRGNSLAQKLAGNQ